jgi:hypothetical protein
MAIPEASSFLIMLKPPDINVGINQFSVPFKHISLLYVHRHGLSTGEENMAA